MSLHRKTQNRILDIEDRTCLRNLMITDPRDDKTRIQTQKGGLLEDAYRWVLNHDDFKKWHNDENSRLLWIKGDPGKGKTMLLCGIIDELAKSVPDKTSTSFFFCQAADSRINSATAVLRCLIYLLIEKQPSIISHVRQRYDQTGKQLFEGVNSWESLLKIFTNILDDPLLNSTYLIIDGLDECTIGLFLLLDLVVQKSSSHPHIKWVVSIRNWITIEEHLDAAPQNTRLQLDLNEKSVSEAVTLYIQRKVKELSTLKKYPSDIHDTVQNHLLSNAHGTFLWVALVCEELGSADASKWEAEEIVAAFPPGLNNLYQRMISQIQLSKNARLYKQILAITSIVYRPMKLEELCSFLDLPVRRGTKIYYTAESIQRCGSFLTLRNGIVFFVHQSAKDFLLEGCNTVFSRGIGAEHYTIFSRSLSVISKTLRRNIYNIQSPGFLISYVRKPEPDPLAAAHYSCVYWIDHLEDCSFFKNASTNLQEGGSVDIFLQKSFLYWVEALSLIRSLPQGISAMLQLDSFLQVSGSHFI